MQAKKTTAPDRRKRRDAGAARRNRACVCRKGSAVQANRAQSLKQEFRMLANRIFEEQGQSFARNNRTQTRRSADAVSRTDRGVQTTRGTGLPHRVEGPGVAADRSPQPAPRQRQDQSGSRKPRKGSEGRQADSGQLGRTRARTRARRIGAAQGSRILAAGDAPHRGRRRQTSRRHHSSAGRKRHHRRLESVARRIRTRGGRRRRRRARARCAST